MNVNVESVDFRKGNGLVPAILQDSRTKQVLMLGYMNQEALEETLRSGKATFYSRSKERLWLKGETTGHYQLVDDIQLDCDQDTLLISVTPQGPTCHLGTASCFEGPYFSLGKLAETIDQKWAEAKDGSYTAYLKAEGIDKILKKNGEEMTEVIIAAKNQDKEELVNEASDLLYHFLVLLKQQGVSLTDVEAQLAERHGQSSQYSIRNQIKDW